MGDVIDEIRKHPTYSLVCRRYAPFETFGVAFPFGGGRFQGDNRGPSISLKDSSRIYQVVLFNRYGPVLDYAGSSGTHYHSTLFGEIVGRSKITKTMVQTTLNGPDLFGIETSTAGGNPLVPGAPDINTFMKARIDFGHQGFLGVQCDVYGDNFPNLEVFLISAKSTRASLLIDGWTTGGRNFGPQTRLWGESRNRKIAGCYVTIALNSDGTFASDYTASPSTLQ